jgi:polysaccharide export outer membrane protein
MTRVQFRSLAAFPKALLVGAFMFAAACSTPTAPPPEFQSAPVEGTYVIGAADVIRISVWKNVELNIDAPVRPDGKISVPLIDDVQAAGLTTLELKEVVTAELNEYISNPDVTVIVLNTGSKRVSVVGEVLRPGPVAMASQMRVLDAISVASGFGPFADRSDIRVIRFVDGVEHEYVFDYDAYIEGAAPGTNIILHPGDTIVVAD